LEARLIPVSTLFSFKLGLLLFWGLWYAIAFFTNLCESFHALRAFPSTWPFASGNLRDVTQATKTYSGVRWLPRVLFFGVLGVQLLIVCLFGWAFISSVSAGSLRSDPVNAAFSASLGLWAAFMLADEIFKQYDTEHVHVLFLIAQLVTFVALHVTP
jgi:hypothetical protein